MTTQPNIVAILDDDPRVTKAVNRLVASYGYRTALFSSVDDFMKNLATTNAACLITDIELGQDSGVELARRLARLGAGIPVIFMTGSDNDVIRSQALEVGCV